MGAGRPLFSSYAKGFQSFSFRPSGQRGKSAEESWAIAFNQHGSLLIAGSLSQHMGVEVGLQRTEGAAQREDAASEGPPPLLLVWPDESTQRPRLWIRLQSSGGKGQDPGS